MKPGSICDIYTEPLINKLQGKQGGTWLVAYDTEKHANNSYIKSHFLCKQVT